MSIFIVTLWYMQKAKNEKKNKPKLITESLFLIPN